MNINTEFTSNNGVKYTKTRADGEVYASVTKKELTKLHNDYQQAHDIIESFEKSNKVLMKIVDYLVEHNIELDDQDKRYEDLKAINKDLMSVIELLMQRRRTNG